MIDYNLLDQSVLHYSAAGYSRIETPWIVPEFVDRITRQDRLPYKLEDNNRCLVGSGEQSFLELYRKKQLPLGKFQTITPCFRHDAEDLLHQKWFMKNELISTEFTGEGALSAVIETAFDFYAKYFHKDALGIVKTEEGYDIEVMGVELGSYGIRECEFLRWVYGTGCAEPRTSNLIRLWGITQNK